MGGWVGDLVRFRSGLAGLCETFHRFQSSKRGLIIRLMVDYYPVILDDYFCQT